MSDGDRITARYSASGAGGGGGEHKCEFCGGGPDPLDPMLGPWPASQGGAKYYSHHKCTVWASEVYEEDGALQKVTQAIERGKGLMCSKCRKKGAATGCHVRTCRRTYHVKCAEQANAQFRPADMRLYCHEHHTDDSVDAADSKTPARKKSLGKGKAGTKRKRAADDDEQATASATASGSGGGGDDAADSAKYAAEKALVFAGAAHVRDACHQLVDAMLVQPNAWPFMEPVDPVKLGLPMYFSIVKKPMDLGTVKQKLTRGAYPTVHDFAQDVRQVWQNCLLYNDPNSEVADFAEEMRDWFDAGLVDAGIVPDSAHATTTSARGKASAHKRNDPLCTYCERLKYQPTTAPGAAPAKSAADVDDDDASGDAKGVLLCCDGPCLRSFHLACAGIAALPVGGRWYCADCRLRMHQCFVCAKWGIDGADVFRCGVAGPPAHTHACGRFYHPYCVAMTDDEMRAAVSAPADDDAADDSDGETGKKRSRKASRKASTKKAKAESASGNGGSRNNTFVCPKHSCAQCRVQFDPKTDKPLATAIVECFRCIRTWHARCAPPATDTAAATTAATPAPATTTGGAAPASVVKLQPKRYVRCCDHAPAPATVEACNAARTAFVAQALAEQKINAEQAGAARDIERKPTATPAAPAAAASSIPAVVSVPSASVSVAPSPVALYKMPPAVAAAIAPPKSRVKKGKPRGRGRDSDEDSGLPDSDEEYDFEAARRESKRAHNRQTERTRPAQPAAQQPQRPVRAPSLPPLPPLSAAISQVQYHPRSAAGVWRALGLEAYDNASVLPRGVGSGSRLTAYLDAVTPAAASVWTGAPASSVLSGADVGAAARKPVAHVVIPSPVPVPIGCAANPIVITPASMAVAAAAPDFLKLYYQLRAQHLPLEPPLQLLGVKPL